MVKSIMKFLIVAPILFLAAAPALALEDTPANRTEQANNYLRVVPPESTMKDMTEKLAATLPENKRDVFRATMTKNFDIHALTDLMRDGMVKSFTADELKALADFYGTPAAQSAMAKMGNYMATIMPGLTAQLQKALALTQQQQLQSQPK